MSYQVSIEVRFSSAHRLLGYSGKCACLHGHSYKATITVESDQVDSQGFVVDFGDLKKAIKWWIDEQLDHNAILRIDDPLANFIAGEVVSGRNGGKAPFLMTDNPTAENIAFQIWSFVLSVVEERNRLTAPRVRLVSVKVNEEEGTMACVREAR